jgi:phosphoserine phosphatase
MQIAITLVAPQGRVLASDAVDEVRHAVRENTGPVWLEPNHACDIVVTRDTAAAAQEIRAAIAPVLAARAVDWAVQPAAARRKRVLVSDMDSTIIGQECIDEIADFAGVGPQVAGITARAMAGELDFETALGERVALLGGLSADKLQRVLTERITVNPGAATLVATMHAHGAYTLLVSGGFTFFAEPVAAMVGFDGFQANQLIIEAGHLTGRVAKPILGREAKHEALLAECRRLGVDPSSAAALGDGANDLAIIEAAGLGIAYHAKPIVAAGADARIEHGDLTAALYFQGYRRGEFPLA